MDVLVRLEARPTDSPVLAYVNSIPVLPFGTRSRREVVTLYGHADAQSLALALAATVESERLEAPQLGVVRHLGVWPDRGAIGDSAWRDLKTGRLMTQDLDIAHNAKIAGSTAQRAQGQRRNRRARAWSVSSR